MDSQLHFPCMMCQVELVVPSELAGRPVRCPHCREVSIAPVPAAQELELPEFTKPVEGADSILSEDSPSDDSVIDDGTRKGFQLEAPDWPSGVSEPPTFSSGPAFTPSLPPEVATITPEILSSSPPASIDGFPMPQVAMYYPPELKVDPPQENPFIPPESPSPSRPAGNVSKPLPVREITIALLAVYGLLMTFIAVIGWTRSSTVQVLTSNSYHPKGMSIPTSSK